MIRIRPDFHLSSLNVKYRWESTRRHPIYIQLWKLWKGFRDALGEGAELAFFDEPQILVAMKQLGINGLLIDPAIPFENLTQEDVKPQWLRGAIQPISIRALTGLLIASLGEEALTEISQILRVAAEAQKDSDARKLAVIRLKQSNHEEFDGILDAPFYSISPVAPREQMIADLTKVQAEWRERFDLPNSRFREADLPNYLRAWDLREGWENGEYRRSSMRRINDVAAALGTNKTTTNNWYRSGFRLITGHSFSPDNWRTLMGVVHFSDFIPTAVNQVSLTRLRSGSSSRTVDDSTVSSGGNQENRSVVESISAIEPDSDVDYLLQQITAMLTNQCSTQHIQDELGLSDQAIEVIEHLRETLQIAPGADASK